MTVANPKVSETHTIDPNFEYSFESLSTASLCTLVNRKVAWQKD